MEPVDSDLLVTLLFLKLLNKRSIDDQISPAAKSPQARASQPPPPCRPVSPATTSHHLSSPTAADARVLSVSMTVHYDSFAFITYSLIIVTCITYSHLHHLQRCFKRVPGVPRVGLSVARWVEGFGQFGWFGRFWWFGRFGQFGRWAASR